MAKFDKDHIPEYKLSITRIIATILAYVILFGVPFGIGILVGHFCW